MDPDISLQDLLSLCKNPTELERSIQHAKELKFLIIGQTGTGKSTLINGLIGAEVAEVKLGLSTSGVSDEVVPYRRKISGVDVVVYDSPGLEDGSQQDNTYLDKLHDKSHDVDLVIFTIRMANRFVPDNPDARALVKFTRRFGPAVWKKGIVIITCANLIEDLNPQAQLHLKSEKERHEFFAKVMSDYKHVIHHTLVKQACVPAEIVEGVKVVPVGHEFNSQLLDGTLWFSNFWFECLIAIPTSEARATMIKVNVARFKSDKNITSEDFTKPLTEQPIVVQQEKAAVDRPLPLTVGTVMVPACVGGLVGAIGLVGGPVGLLGIPIGVFIGMTIGAVVAAKLDEKRSKTKQ